MTGFRAWFTLFLATFGLVLSPAVSRHGVADNLALLVHIGYEPE